MSDSLPSNPVPVSITPSGPGSTPPDCHEDVTPESITQPEQKRGLGPETSGEAIAGYVIEAELGCGGMGVVYRARQKGLGQLVALKMILHAGHAALAWRGVIDAGAGVTAA